MPPGDSQIGEGKSNQWLNFQFGTSASQETDRLSEATAPTSFTADLKSTLSASTAERLTAAGYMATSAKPDLPPSSSDPQMAFVALDQLAKLSAQYNETFRLNGFPGTSAFEVVREESDNLPVADPHINKLAAALGLPPGFLQKIMWGQASTMLNDKLFSLTKEQTNQLKFALAHPEQMESLDPALKKLLEDALGDIHQKLASQYHLPDDWQGIELNVSEFQNEITLSYEGGFNQALAQRINSGSVSKEHAVLLRSLFYGVETDPPASEETFAILAELKAQAKGDLQKKYSFDDSWEPTPSPTFYQDVLNGAFIKSFTDTLNHKDSPLTAEQKAEVLNYSNVYFTNPNDPSIPKEIKTLLDNLAKIATDMVIRNYALPPTWSADIITLSPAGIDPKAMNLALGGIATARELLRLARERVEAMPDSPEKGTYFNYLKTLSDALVKLEESIYAVQASQTDSSKKLNQLRLTEVIANSALQSEKSRQIDVHQDKMSSLDLGPLNDIMDIATKVAIVGFSALLGPVALAIAIMYVSKPKETVDKVFEAVTDACVQAMGEKAGRAIAGVSNIFISYILASGNPILFINFMSQNSKAINDITKASGGDDSDAMIASAVVQATAQVVMAIGMTILTAGAGSGVTMTTILQSTGMAARTIGMVTKVAQVTSTLTTLTMVGLTGYKGGIEINNNIVEADIVMLRAQMDASEEKTRAMVELIQTIVKKIMEMLTSNPEWILNINEERAGMFSKASQITTEIAAASGA